MVYKTQPRVVPQETRGLRSGKRLVNDSMDRASVCGDLNGGMDTPDITEGGKKKEVKLVFVFTLKWHRFRGIVNVEGKTDN